MTYYLTFPVVLTVLGIAALATVIVLLILYFAIVKELR